MVPIFGFESFVHILFCSTTGTARAQPVKVEGFEQLMGGDSSLKHETEDKLRSPPTK